MPWSPLPSDVPDPAPVGESLDRLLRSWDAASVDTTRSLFGEWDQIVGPQVARYAHPATLRRGTLVVAVDDPAWATQLRFLEAELIARITAATGTDEVRAIEVRVAGSPRSTGR